MPEPRETHAAIDARRNAARAEGDLGRARYEVLRDHVARLSSHVSLGVEVLAEMDEAERARHRRAIADRLDKHVADLRAALAPPPSDPATDTGGEGHG